MTNPDNKYRMIRSPILDGPGIRGLRDSFFPASKGPNIGKVKPVRFQIGGHTFDEGRAMGYGGGVFGTDDGFAWLEVPWMRLLAHESIGFVFGGPARVVNGEGAVYRAALERFDEYVHHRRLAVSGFFCPAGDRKGFIHIGVTAEVHIEH